MMRSEEEARFPWPEWTAVSLALPLAAAAWIVHLGGGSVSWDGYNHHVYLGMQALHGPRLMLDVFAVGGMSCQYPLGYAPFAALMEAGFSGAVIFAVLAIIAGLMAPAIWLIQWQIVRGTEPSAVALRIMGCLLAFTGILWWKVLGQSSNDLIALVVGLWSVALGAIAMELSTNQRRHFYVLWAIAGALAGAALVIKLTMFIAPCAAAAFLALSPQRLLTRAYALGCAALTASLSALVLGREWAFEAWKACGTPVYPFLEQFFSQLRLF